MPLIMLGGGAILKGVGGFLSGRKKDKAAADQARLNNQQREEQRLAQMKILAGLEDAGWNPFGVNQLKSGENFESSSSTNQSGVRDSYTKENPFTTPEYQKTDELVRGILENRLSRGSSLPPGYEANAIRAINAASAGGAAAASNAAARRGLSGQQVFGLNAPIQTARAGQIADLRGNVPLLERQMTNEDMAAQGQRQAQFGTGRESRTHETSSSRSNTNSRGSSAGFRDVAPNVNDLSTLLMPPGTQQSTLSPNSNWGSTLSGAGDAAEAAAMLMAGQQPRGGGAGSGQMPSSQCPPGNPYRDPMCG